MNGFAKFGPKKFNYGLPFGIKFIYLEKATKFCKISTVDLTGTTWHKPSVEILQNFVAFSEYMNY